MGGSLLKKVDACCSLDDSSVIDLFVYFGVLNGILSFNQLKHLSNIRSFVNFSLYFIIILAYSTYV